VAEPENTSDVTQEREPYAAPDIADSGSFQALALGCAPSPEEIDTNDNCLQGITS
jgi:hypothetical protein